MPESLIFLTENSPGVSNDRFGFMVEMETPLLSASSACDMSASDVPFLFW